MMAIATLRFYYCGRGDTILLEASGGGEYATEWALVDCHLTKVSGAYYRVRDIIEEKRIPKLKFVCLTHPDRDHYWGMRELLEECFYDRAKDQLRVDEFWDADLHPERLAAIARRLGTKCIQREIEELYRFVMPFSLADKIDHWVMDQGMQSKIDLGCFYFLSLSPRRNRVDRFNQRAMDDILGATYTDARYEREKSNDLSVVLVLMHKTLPVSIILGGDATAETWEEALDLWPRLAQRCGRQESSFAGVKVSHHGAQGSLYSKLYEDYCEEGETIAILTVGPNDRNHPHQEVLDVLAKRKIRTYATCWPTGGTKAVRPHIPLPGNRLAQVVGKGARLTGYDWADIEVFIQHDGKLKVKP